MPSCGICSSAGDHELLQAREMVHGTREPFHYMLCSACGTLSLLDPPADLAPYYQNYYSTSPLTHDPFRSSSAMGNAFKRWAFRHSILGTGRVARSIYRRKTVGALYWGPLFSELRRLGFPVALDTRMLDVGSGNGHQLHLLASAGFTELRGCDPFIEQDIDLEPRGKILKAHLEQVEGTYDLVMFHHSFEHVPDPDATLEAATRLLRPGGAIVLRFPHIGSYEFLKHRENWWAIHAPRHFFLLAPKAVALLADRSGLWVQHAYCDSTFDHYLYSTEYALGIHDGDPLSFRRDGQGTWTALELNMARERAEVLNPKLCGDWICYVLRHAAS